MKTSSASSRPAKPAGRNGKNTNASAASHRNVRATPEEIAYEPPANVDFSGGFVIRGQKAYQEYRKWRRNFVRVRPELRQAFPDDKSVNEALEKVLAIMNMKAGKPRKSA